MRQKQWTRFGALAVLLLALGALPASDVLAQQSVLDQAVTATVRVLGCNLTGCNVGLGSGVIIHPSGVILTANHVTLTDARNPLSPHLEDFVIELTQNARSAPVARYRARLLATKPASDLALLGIYWDEVAHRPLDDTAPIGLPALPIADAGTIALGERLHILGYPLAGGTAINYTEAALGGFDEDGAMLKANVSLNEGYSGGPVLVERDGQYEIVGVVVLRRADVSYIRSVDQLGGMMWEPAARRVWADNVQATMQGSGADQTLRISADLHALDYAGREGRLLAYAYDSAKLSPWLPIEPRLSGDSGGNLWKAPNGQLVLRTDFKAGQPVEIERAITVEVPWSEIGGNPQQLLFRLVLWDPVAAHALWRGAEWYSFQLAPTTFTPPVNSVIQTRTPTSAPTPNPTWTQALTLTVKHTATRSATSTPTAPPTTPTTPTASDIGYNLPNVQCEDFPMNWSDVPGDWPEVRSSWRENAVVLDGRITSSEEWIDSTCLALTLAKNIREQATIPTKWWIKNDAEWLYLLVKVDTAQFEATEASVSHFWPYYELPHGWKYSDSGTINQSNETFDYYGFDDMKWEWQTDIEASPPGEDNVDGAADRDVGYSWFEFRKALDSGDGYDWSVAPGDALVTGDAVPPPRTLLGVGNTSTYFGRKVSLIVATDTTRVSKIDGMVMAHVPAGEFLMGSTDAGTQANSDEKPQRKVYLDAFWIDKTEVTKAQYQQCVESGACPTPTCPGTGQRDHPVVCVSWQDAMSYCAWAERRLPTEAEWEKAARGTDGRMYPWGKEAPDCGRLNYRGQDGTCVGGTARVGSYASGASPYGALDMAGNVWEWVADWYDETYYSGAPGQNPKGPDSGQYRVLRGGSWLHDQSFVRAALRGWLEPAARDDNLGFRCARSP